MKKLFLLPVLFFLVLASCKDDEGDPAPLIVSEQIKGTWVTTNEDSKYYNASGQVVHEETSQTETVFKFDGSKVTTTYASGGIGMLGTYTTSKRGGKDYITLVNGSSSAEFEITAMSGSAMTWKAEKDNAPYFDNGMKTADYAVTTIEFSKR
ncbi:hypothetical protein GCM10023188_44500 [Pontibacter saemangeumensis]|uniref:Lipocalin-like domain-containing protein n=1 Tax=Pontibacter saemangeumensis TaxID=1084525 RepID=A0ABP8M575_9BACT